MSKVITFSLKFPSYHIECGKPTYFVEQILNHLKIEYLDDNYLQKLLILNDKNIQLGKLSFEDVETFFIGLKDVQGNKLHTIRGGNRFKVNEMFSPRVWSGKPYKSPQIIFWDDIKIENVWDFEISPIQQMLPLDPNTVISVNHRYLYTEIDTEKLRELANNDGLKLSEMLRWFQYPKPFTGSIICWSNKLKY
jgi:hypothetical protein